VVSVDIPDNLYREIEKLVEESDEGDEEYSL